jgi:Ca-activated chloride channel family protein
MVLLLLLTACDSPPAANPTSGGAFSGGSQPPSGYEIYVENGGIVRPSNAVDVFIVYSPESQSYMPDIIRSFNEQSAGGKNPVSGAAYGADEKPVFVWGTDPVTGSSGTVMNGIVNAIIAPNDANIYRPTIYQPSVGHWLALANYYSGRDLFDLNEAQATAISPVVIATWQSRLAGLKQTLNKDEFGWQDLLAVLNSPQGWCDFNIEDCRRAVYLGQADPNTSSTGLSTAIMQYYACARENGFTGRRLTAAAVRDAKTQACVNNIQALTKHYSNRTEDFLPYLERGPDFLDFLGMEEGDVVCINTGSQQGDETCNKPPAGDTLVAIYPAEGTYLHEHPFGIVNAEWVSAEQKTAAQLFTAFVLTETPQRRIMQEGFRPANSAVTLDYPFVAENGINPEPIGGVLDVPEAEAIVAIQETWTNVKKPADVIVLVDVSGSMQSEGRLDQARQGIVTLIEKMNPRNRVALYAFSDTITVWSELDLVERRAAAIRQQALCDGTNECLQPLGGTAMYNAVRESVLQLSTQSAGTDRIRIVLLLSDGQDTCEPQYAGTCYTLSQATEVITATYNTPNPVIVVPIAYGSDADMRALTALANASRVEVVSGDPTNILNVLARLSGYY